MIESHDSDLTPATSKAAGLRRSRRLRYTLGTVTVAAALVGGVGCSSKSDTAKKTDKGSTTTVKKGDATTPPSTVTDDEFNKSFGEIRKQIEAAGTDPCKLIEAFKTSPPQPSNATQVKEVLDTYKSLLGQMAQIIGADTDDGKALIAASDQMRKAAEAKGNDPKFLQGEEFTKVMSGEAVTKALGTFQTKAAACLTSTTAAG